MILKLLSVLLLLCSTNFVLAENQGIWSDGYVTYLHPNGNLVDRECKLWVPAMGQGEVTLVCSKFSMASSDFLTTKENGKTTFTVYFKNIPGAPENSIARYSGAYLRGKNRALYYGDVYSGSEQIENGVSKKVDWRYVGGFMFSKEIQ